MKTIVGIDLGTSTSEISILNNGKPFVIPNKEGECIIPSVVAIDEKGELIIGNSAKEQMLINPHNTVLEVKRLMGSDAEVRMGGKTYKPEEIASFIVKYLIGYAKEYLGKSIENAVISVPAYFSDEQRRATVKAGELAGIKVERIINEPTAAALDYGIDHMEEEQTILIYDLGGGTLDVTVLEMFDGVLEVKSSSGDNKLGGKDFDSALMDYIIDRFNKANEVDVSSDSRSMMRLKSAVEKCKIKLSTEHEDKIQLPFFFNKDGTDLVLEETITRELFEELIKEKIESSKKPILEALKYANIKENEVDNILLVGGSTRIPYVKKFVNDTLGQEPKTLVDPDLAVTKGAAIQAGIISGELDSEKDIMITDVCPYTLGVEALGYIGMFEREGLFSPVIEKNTTIPCSIEKQYYTVYPEQTKVDVKVYQGDGKIAKDNNFLGNFILDGIEPSFEGGEQIDVRFVYDVNGILNVEAQVNKNKKKANITIETTGVSMEEEIDIEKWIDSPKARKYRSVINKAQNILKQDDDIDLDDNKFELDRIVHKIKKELVKDSDGDILDNLKENITDIIFEMSEV